MNTGFLIASRSLHKRSLAQSKSDLIITTQALAPLSANRVKYAQALEKALAYVMQYMKPVLSEARLSFTRAHTTSADKPRQKLAEKTCSPLSPALVRFCQVLFGVAAQIVHNFGYWCSPSKVCSNYAAPIGPPVANRLKSRAILLTLNQVSLCKLLTALVFFSPVQRLCSEYYGQRWQA